MGSAVLFYSELFRTTVQKQWIVVLARKKHCFCTVVLIVTLFINKKRTLVHTKVLFVRMVGLEPTRGHPRKILSLVRLPFRHIRMCEMFASQQSISYHPLSILSIPFLNFFTKNYSPPSPVTFILHFLPIICSF